MHELTEAIMKLFKNKSLATRTDIAGLKRVEILFSIENNVERIQRIYVETINEHP